MVIDPHVPAAGPSRGAASTGVTGRSDGLEVLHVLVPSRVGGLESVVESLAAAQSRYGQRVRVLAFGLRGDGNPPLVKRLRGKGVRADAVRIPSRGYWREHRRTLFECRNARPDIVHTHGYRADLVSGLAARRSGLPTVSTVHGFTGGDWKNLLYEQVQRWSYSWFDAVVAVSRPLERELVANGLDASRVHVVSNAWTSDIQFASPSAARQTLGVPDAGQKNLIGWVGRLTFEKGADIMLEALARLTHLPWRLVVVGEGREGPSLRRLAADLEIAERVHWTGAVPSAATLFRAFDVLCVSSRREGTPMVLLEAMAAEVPIVATAVGGIPDLVRPGEALLVPSGDPPRLGDAIAMVLEDPVGARLRARAARRRVIREMGPAQWVEKYREVYRYAAEERGFSRERTLLT